MTDDEPVSAAGNATDLPLLASSTDEAPADQPSAGEGPSRRHRLSNRVVILGVLAGILVMVVIIGGVAWHFLAGQESIALKPPASVAGLTLDTSEDAQQTSDYLRNAVGAKTDLNNPIGVVYQDSSDPDRDVLLFGGTRLLINPTKDLDQAFSLMDDKSGSVSGVHDVPAGPLGGVMRCGMSTGDGGPVVVCGWADRGSLVMGLFYGRTPDEAAQLLRELRSAIEHS
jgi:hypothetical protein